MNGATSQLSGRHKLGRCGALRFCAVLHCVVVSLFHRQKRTRPGRDVFQKAEKRCGRHHALLPSLTCGYLSMIALTSFFAPGRADFPNPTMGVPSFIREPQKPK